MSRDGCSCCHGVQLDMSHTADKQKLKGQIKDLTADVAQGAAERQELHTAVEELEAQGLQLQRDLHALQGCKEEAEHLEEENAKCAQAYRSSIACQHDSCLVSCWAMCMPSSL